MSYLTKSKVFADLDRQFSGQDATALDAFKYMVETYPYSGKNPGRFEYRLDKLASEWGDSNSNLWCTVDDPEEEDEPIVNGTLLPVEDTRQKATGKTFILTCAQANTYLNEKFWATLQHMATDLDAELHVSQFTYNKARHGRKSVKPGSKKATDNDDIWFAPEIAEFVSDESLELAPGLIWSGELNLSPTLVNPTTGLDNYGRGASVIAPNAKMAMRSVATMKDSPARFIYTTGTVTQRNYIERAAGQKASLHHVYGALLVEVDDDGTWYVRQLNADKYGFVYDKTMCWGPEGLVDDLARPMVVTHGDIHGNKVDHGVLETMSEVIDQLYPTNQVFHDIVDFQPRNHHNIKDPHFRHEMAVRGLEGVEAEFEEIGRLVGQYLARPDTSHWVITSNHDQAIEGWLRNTDGFYDGINQELWLRLNHRGALQREIGQQPRPFAHLMSKHLPKQYHWHVVHEDESLMIAGIENGLHGHLGPNGARGAPKNLRSVGKANTGHTHSCGIVDGVYTAGVFGKLDMGYNKGLSSWSHSFIVTYPNGKRSIYTIKNGKAWR